MDGFEIKVEVHRKVEAKQQKRRSFGHRHPVSETQGRNPTMQLCFRAVVTKPNT